VIEVQNSKTPAFSPHALRGRVLAKVIDSFGPAAAMAISASFVLVPVFWIFRRRRERAEP
jgi:hypothetical protein